MEIKRIFKTKFIFMIVAVVAVQCILFYKEQLDHDKSFAAENGYSFLAYNRLYNVCRERLESVPADEWDRELHAFYQEQKEVSEEQMLSARAAVKKIREQKSYVDEYTQSVQASIQQAERMIAFSIYSDRTSYGYHNILKSRYDFKKLVDLPVCVSADTFFDRLWINQSAPYALLFLILLTAGMFQIEEKGFRAVLYATKKGRVQLNLQRAGILLFSGILYSALLYGAMLLISLFCYGGASGLGDLLQSNANCQFSMLTISKGGYIVIFALLQGMGAAVAGALFWLLSSLIGNRALSVFTWVVLLLAQYLLFGYTGSHPFGQFFKIVNLFTLLDFNPLLSEYHNWGVGTFIIGRFRLAAVALITGMILFPALAVLYNARAKTMESGIRLPESLHRFKRRLNRKTAKRPNWIKECEKILFVQKGYILLLLLMVYVIGKEFGRPPVQSNVQVILTDYYRTVQGEAGEASERYIENLENWLAESKNLIKVYEESGDVFSKKSLSAEISVREQALAEIRRQTEKVRQMRAQGVNAGIVNTHKMTGRYGDRMAPYTDSFIAVGIGILGLLLFETFNMEKASHMQELIRGTRKGRSGYLRTRLLAALLLSGAVILFINLSCLFKTNQVFPVEWYERGYCIQSTPAFETFPLSVSIQLFDVLLLCYRTVLMLSVAWIIMAFSMFFNREAALVCTVGLLLPYVLSGIGIRIFEPLSVVRPISWLALYAKQGNSVYSVAGGLGIVLLGASAAVMLCRKWNNGGVGR